jgi:hypothetical protein
LSAFSARFTTLPTLGFTGTVAAMAALLVFSAGPAQAAQGPVGLGTADSFAVLAGSTVTNTGPSVITGDLGVYPGSAVTGFGPGIVIGGTIHAADAVAAQAKSDLTVAYNDAAGRATSANVGADLVGQTFVPGVYTGQTLGLTGTVTLDAQGDPDAVFIFQASSTLITASASRVALIGGASACNVYWQVGSSATLGTSSDFVGSVLALTSITATTGATVRGRLLARNGAVTLDDNVITRPTCASSSSSSTTSSSTTSSTSTSSTTVTTSATGSASVTSSSAGTTGPTGAAAAAGSTDSSVRGARETGGGGNAADTGGGTGRLPFTGGNVVGPVTAGLMALALGTMLVLANRPQTIARSRRAPHLRQH